MLKVKGAIDDRPGGTGFPVHVSVESKLYRDLMAMKERNGKDWDSVVGIDGLPGVGKSQLGICTIAPLLAEKMSNIHITFDVDEFVDVCVNKAKPFDVVKLDEGHKGLNTSQAQKADFQRLINLLMLIRKKNLYLIISTQCFFELSKAMAIFRLNVLYHVYDKSGKRGGFAAFGRNEKKQLYINGKKYLNYAASRENYHGQFNKNNHLMPLDYEDRKDAHLIDQNDELKQGNTARTDMANKIMNSTILSLIKLNFTQKHIAKIMGLATSTVQAHWKKMKELGIVPREYLVLYGKGRGVPITPTHTPTGDWETEKPRPSSYSIIPTNTCDGDEPPIGGGTEASKEPQV